MFVQDEGAKTSWGEASPLITSRSVCFSALVLRWACSRSLRRHGRRPLGSSARSDGGRSLE
jgi:hypothetical protein